MNQQITLLSREGCNLRIFSFEHEEKLPVMVILHGGPGSGAEPLLGLSAFQRLNQLFTTVYFDQRCSGESVYDLTKDVSEELLVDDVEAVVKWAKERFPGRPVYLWGGSFGGLLGLLYLKHYPNSVDKAVISSPAIYPAGLAVGEAEILDQLRPIISQADEKYHSILQNMNSIKDLEENPLFTQLMQSITYLPKGLEAGPYFYAIRRWFTKCDARPVLASLQIPSLLLQGMDDPVCLPKILIESYENAKNPLVSLKTYSPCGHAVFEDQEEEFVKEIVRFCK